FEIRGRVNKHFARTVDTIKIIALAWFRNLGPVLKVRKFLFWLLRKQVVRKSNRELAIAMQRVHHAIVIRIVLKTSAGINGAGEAKPVQLPEKQARRVELVLA